MSAQPRRSGKGLALLAENMSERDMAIIRQVAQLRLMTAKQIRTLYFPTSAHASEIASARACHRVLGRLAADRLVARLDRRIGGVRAGSGSFIYALGPAGQRLLTDGPRRRSYEPTARFVDHTLAISQLVVDATLADRALEVALVGYQAEPECWRVFSRAGARVVLRPDLFITIDKAGFRYPWWCEVDRATESLPVIVRKCRLYSSYYQSGIEQSGSGGKFPRVCWIAPNERRAKRIQGAIARDRQLPERLFVVTSQDRALNVLAGGTP